MTEAGAACGDPSRRRFLRVTGAGVLAAVLVPACRTEPDAEAPAAPTTGTGADGGTTTDGALPAGDVDLLVAAVELERALANFHARLTERRGAELDAVAAGTTIERLAANHDERASLLDDALRTGGHPRPAGATDMLGIALPEPDDLDLLPLAQLVRSARDLEDAGVQTAITMVPRLRSDTARRLVVDLAVAGARHLVALDLLLGPVDPAMPVLDADGGYPTAASRLLG